MLKWISLVIVVVLIGLYFSGALELSDGGDSIDVSIDKEKAQDLGKSIRESLEE